MKMERNYWVGRLETAIRGRDARMVESALEGLIFLGASVYEPRGVADAKLKIEDLGICLAILHEGGWPHQRTAEWVASYVDRQSREGASE